MSNYPQAIGTLTPETTAPQQLFPGMTVLAFDAENPAVPQASIQFAIAAGGPWAIEAPHLSVELHFATDPGVFQVDVQAADTDADAYFQTIPSAGILTAVSATYFVARTEIVWVKARFIRLNIVSRANDVDLTAKISR